MGTLTILFQGICIHMTEMSPYRIVTPTGAIPHGPYSLAPTITLPPATSLPCLGLTPTAGTFSLNGVTFLIGDEGLGRPEGNIECTLHLRDFPFTPPLNMNMVAGEQAPAAAYFDVTAGSFALSERPASAGVAYAELTLDFPGDEATIAVRCWNGGAVQTITIPDLPQTITVDNVPSPPPLAQDAREYLGNFLVAEPMSPLDTDVHIAEIDAALLIQTLCLGARFGDRKSTFPIFDTFPSCSNSQWP